MARIHKDQSLVALLKPDYAEDKVVLSSVERRILEKALAICEKTSQLQQQLNERTFTPPEFDSFGWAEIYLREVLD